MVLAHQQDTQAISPHVRLEHGLPVSRLGWNGR